MKNYISPDLKFIAASPIEKISTTEDGVFDAKDFVYGSTPNEAWITE